MQSKNRTIILFFGLAVILIAIGVGLYYKLPSLLQKEGVDTVVVKSDDALFRFPSENFEFTKPIGWKEVSTSSIKIPDGISGGDFAFAKENSSCVIYHTNLRFEEKGKLGYFAQTSFADRVFAGKDQLDSSWYVNTKHIPINMSFQWEGRQKLPREIRIVYYPYVQSTNTEGSPVFLLFDVNGDVVSDTCNKEFSDMLSTLKHVYPDTTLTNTSKGVIYMYPQENLLGIFFMPDQEQTAYKVMTLDIGSSGSSVVVYDGGIYYAGTDGQLKKVNVIDKTISNLQNLGVKEGDVINTFNFIKGRLFYLAGKSCNEYRAQCDNSLYEYHDGKPELLAEHSMSREILGFDQSEKNLYLLHGEGDAGCSWTTTELFNFTTRKLEKGHNYSFCLSEDGAPADGDDTEARRDYEEFMKPFADRLKAGNLLRVENGMIRPTTEKRNVFTPYMQSFRIITK